MSFSEGGLKDRHREKSVGRSEDVGDEGGASEEQEHSSESWCTWRNSNMPMSHQRQASQCAISMNDITMYNIRIAVAADS